MILAPHQPPPPLPPVSSTDRKTEKERKPADRRGDGGGAKYYDSEKAWSPITHSILSVIGSPWLWDTAEPKFIVVVWELMPATATSPAWGCPIGPCSMEYLFKDIRSALNPSPLSLFLFVVLEISRQKQRCSLLLN
jgi:hypothetical protein